jgi:hypothetical protein
VVSFTPRPLYPQGKSPWQPLNRRLGGPQNWSGCCGEVKILDPTWSQTPTPVIQTIASHSLYQLHYPGSLNYILPIKNMTVPYISDYLNKFHYSTLTGRSWDRSASTEARLWTGQLHLIPVRGRDIFLYHRVQTGSGENPACYPTGTRW